MSKLKYLLISALVLALVIPSLAAGPNQIRSRSHNKSAKLPKAPKKKLQADAPLPGKFEGLKINSIYLFES